MTDQDNISRTYAIRMPSGYTVDPSQSRREAEARCARYRDTSPAAEVVTQLSVEGEWVPADQDPELPAVPPRRGDVVEAWLKARRNEYREQTDDWFLIDEVLDQYRLHADTGTPLDQHVCERGTTDDCPDCYEVSKGAQR